MMIVALLMRPWLVLIKSMHVEPKVLADDVCIIAKGRRIISKPAKALEATHEYCQDFGARIAPTKSYSFATTQKARDWLQRTRWKTIETVLLVVQDFRYLGAHMNTTGRKANSTGDARWSRGLAQLGKLKRLGADIEARHEQSERKCLQVYSIL